jgi:hypothetical protein
LIPPRNRPDWSGQPLAFRKQQNNPYSPGLLKVNGSRIIRIIIIIVRIIIIIVRIIIIIIIIIIVRIIIIIINNEYHDNKI